MDIIIISSNVIDSCHDLTEKLKLLIWR